RLALLVLDQRRALLPLDVVVGGDASGGEVSLQAEAAVLTGGSLRRLSGGGMGASRARGRDFFRHGYCPPSTSSCRQLILAPPQVGQINRFRKNFHQTFWSAPHPPGRPARLRPIPVFA